MLFTLGNVSVSNNNVYFCIRPRSTETTHIYYTLEAMFRHYPGDMQWRIQELTSGGRGVFSADFLQKLIYTTAGIAILLYALEGSPGKF